MFLNSDLKRRLSNQTLTYLIKYYIRNYPNKIILFILERNYHNNPTFSGYILIELCKGNYYNTILQFYEYKPKIQIDSYNDAFHFACMNGYLHIAKWLFQTIPKINMKSTFIEVCQRGHIEIAQWLLIIKPFFKQDLPGAFRDALTYNRIEIVKWVFEQWQIKSTNCIFLQTCQKGFDIACQNGHFELAQWLYQINNYILVDYELFTITCLRSHINIAKWLLTINPNINILKGNNDLFQSMCKIGLLDLAKWLLNIMPTINISANEEYAFRLACKNGHIEVTKWLLNIQPNINISIGDDYAFRKACENGHIEVTKWLLNIQPNINISIDDDYAFRKACENGHIEVAKWLLKIQPNINVSICDEYAFRNVCENGHIEIAKWLLKNYPMINITMVTEYENNEIDYENDDYMSYYQYRYQYEYQYGYTKNAIRYENVFSLACKNGHLEIAKWLLENNSMLYQSIKYEDICNRACKEGYIEILQLIMEMKTNIKTAKLTHYFWLACLNGHIEIAKYLYQMNPFITLTYMNDEQKINQISCDGYSQIIRWLCDIMPPICTYYSHLSEQKKHRDHIILYLYHSNKYQVLSSHILKYIFIQC